MNREVTLKVLGHLRREHMHQMLHPNDHNHFDMDNWAYLVVDGEVDVVKGEPDEPPTLCGLAACLAGTAVLLTRPLEEMFRYNERWSSWSLVDVDWENDGAEALGLDRDTAGLLFIQNRWPLMAYVNSDRTVTQAAIWLLEELLVGRLKVDAVPEWYDVGMFGMEPSREFPNYESHKICWYYNGEPVPADTYEEMYLRRWEEGYYDLEEEDEDEDDELIQADS
jgi:hypothetical protein